VSDETEQERRLRRREMVAVVADINYAGANDDTMGIIRDISTMGARLLTFAKVSEGDNLTLDLRLGSDEEAERLKVDCRVVRVSELDHENRGLWRRTVAVKFDEELTGKDDAIARLAGEAKAILGE
jgi:hypothetical protein